MPSKHFISWLFQYPVLWLSFGLLLVVLPVRPEIASLANLEILALSTAMLLVLAIGQTFVLITAGIDLSLPAVMSLASVVGASLIGGEGPLAGSPFAVSGTLLAMGLVGLAIGTLQGIAVGVFRMPAFLVSLASLMFFGGLAVWYTRSARIALPDEFIQIWYGRLAGIPYPILLVVLLAACAHMILARTVIGRWLYAVGQSLPASFVSGVPVQRTILFAYMASGLCAAIGAVFYSARLHTGSPQLVENEVLLDCIGAAVMGGTSLFGGQGKILGVLFGTLFLALVGNSLNLLGLRYWHVIMIKGGVILLATLLDATRHRMQPVLGGLT